MNRSTLNASLREHTGSGSNHQLRNEKQIPAVLYGVHLDENILLSVSERDLEVFLNHNNLGSALDLNINGEESFVLLKDIQFHPVSRKVLHVDFQALKSGEAIRVTIPIFIKGRESLNNLVVQNLLSELEISCLPKYLIDNITLDVSDKDHGDQFLVSDLDIYKDENIEVLSDPDSIIYLVNEAQVFQEPETEESESFEVEGEVQEEAAAEEASEE